MTNLQKWRSYLDGLTSPDSFINFGYYYLVAASLQRRVWFGPDHMPLYPNQYPIFVAPPGVGKGLVIKKVAEMLKFWKLQSPDEIKLETEDKIDRAQMEAAAQANYTAGKAEEERSSRDKKHHEKPLLIPVAADASSYEALTQAMAKSLRFINHPIYDPITQKTKQGLYIHSSLCFCLEEISSLFRKHADDVVNFLLVAYDCGDYKKDTKTQGVDQIQKCCLNFLGGTQPSFMQRTFHDGLLNEGFSSRAWMIFESRNRKDDLFIPDLTPEQEQHKIDILNHIKALTKLFGRVKISDEGTEYLKQWWKEVQCNRANTNEKLQHYYARKNIHVIKLAIAIHFGESLTMEISKDTCALAVKILDGIEKKMHHALLKKSENPYYKVGMKIIAWIDETGDKTEKELLAFFWEDLPTNKPREALNQILEHYIIMGKIITNGEKYRVIREKEEDLHSKISEAL